MVPPVRSRPGGEHKSNKSLGLMNGNSIELVTVMGIVKTNVHITAGVPPRDISPSSTCFKAAKKASGELT